MESQCEDCGKVLPRIDYVRRAPPGPVLRAQDPLCQECWVIQDEQATARERGKRDTSD